MVDVKLEIHYLTVTAVDGTNKDAPITTAFFKGVSRNGLGGHTEPLPMYTGGKPVVHAFTVDPRDPISAKWVIQAQNAAAGSPKFSVEHSLDITSNHNLNFIVVPSGPTMEQAPTTKKRSLKR